jgi:hypothetical protein
LINAFFFDAFARAPAPPSKSFAGNFQRSKHGLGYRLYPTWSALGQKCPDQPLFIAARER